MQHYNFLSLSASKDIFQTAYTEVLSLRINLAYFGSQNVWTWSWHPVDNIRVWRHKKKKSFFLLILKINYSTRVDRTRKTETLEFFSETMKLSSETFLHLIEFLLFFFFFVFRVTFVISEPLLWLYASLFWALPPDVAHTECQFNRSDSLLSRRVFPVVFQWLLYLLFLSISRECFCKLSHWYFYFQQSEGFEPATLVADSASATIRLCWCYSNFYYIIVI